MSKTSITVTKESYPTLFKAFQAMQNDNGISGESTYVVHCLERFEQCGIAFFRDGD